MLADGKETELLMIAGEIAAVTADAVGELGEPTQGVWRREGGPAQTVWRHHCT